MSRHSLTFSAILCTHFNINSISWGYEVVKKLFSEMIDRCESQHCVYVYTGNANCHRSNYFLKACLAYIFDNRKNAFLLFWFNYLADHNKGTDHIIHLLSSIYTLVV